MIKRLTFPTLKFKFKEFDTREQLEEYLQHADYGFDKQKPGSREGICFGFTVHEHKENDFELELFFNDAIVLDYRSIPD